MIRCFKTDWGTCLAIAICSRPGMKAWGLKVLKRIVTNYKLSRTLSNALWSNRGSQGY
ncbi:exported protein of unknown function [Methanoculleus bourgensis]|uniref:Uncharacterized protein n=1 Tax=Methanoculleus bourgensis TaxID=83986 RepID=A0A0X3BKH3_9EURY|nr:exported protein of unknown function [Methanoculleus bourgensis]